MKTILEKIKEEIKEKGIKRNITYDVFIYNECMVIIDSFKNEYKNQIINSFNQGFREGETETMVADIKKDVSKYDDAINYYNSTFGDSNEAGI